MVESMIEIEQQVISHSEADQFLSCERKHYYAFGHPIEIPEGISYGLEPKTLANGLFKGITGHEALAAFYSYLKPITLDGVPTEKQMTEARAKAYAVLTEAMKDNPDRLDLVANLITILKAYFDYYNDEDQFEWQYLSVEDEYRVDLSDQVQNPFKPDLIRRHRKTGVVQVVDHKFLANLYNGEEIGILPQLTKYVGYLRMLGYRIDDAVYNLISNRVLVTKPYEGNPQTMKRINLHLTDRRVEKTIQEQTAIAERVADYKTDPDWESRVLRTANSFNCKNCGFLAICTADLNGEDTSVAVKYNYKPNSYGYGEAVILDD
jgi:CRISPR/Cas system-associated exonuclease Cas4 (RecB family)